MFEEEEENVESCHHEDVVIDEAVLKGSEAALQGIVRLIRRREEEHIPLNTPECIFEFRVDLAQRLYLKELFEESFFQARRQMSERLRQVLGVKQRMHEELLQYSNCLRNLKQIGKIYQRHRLFDGEILSHLQKFLTKGPRVRNFWGCSVGSISNSLNKFCSN